MTEKQLRRFVTIRNKSSFQSNLQFGFDARDAGFDAADLGDCKKVSDGVYEWQTPHGRLVETFGVLDLVK